MAVRGMRKRRPIGKSIRMRGTAEQAFASVIRDRRAQLAAGAVVAAAAAAAGRAGYDRLVAGDREPSRRYRLRRSESAKDGVRRIAVERADDALEQLDAARDGDFAAGVHEARKDLKKLRSLLRMVRDGLGEQTYRRENDRFRDAARRLSGARDAEVKLQTLAALEERLDGALPGGTVSVVRESLERRRPDGNEGEHLRQLEAATREIDIGRERIPDWRFERGGWNLLEPGLRRSYRRGRKRMAATREEPSGENVHEWRKRVKDLWYHLRVVRRSCPEALGPEADRAHELSDVLGDHHDLLVLGEHVRSDQEGLHGGIDRVALLKAIARRQGELLDEAFRLGDRVYSERPGEFSERIEKHWKAWRNS
jgi:CHAD domain-containing protein